MRHLIGNTRTRSSMRVLGLSINLSVSKLTWASLNVTICKRFSALSLQFSTSERLPGAQDWVSHVLVLSVPCMQAQFNISVHGPPYFPS